MENTQEPIFVEDTVDNGVIENVHIAPIGNFTGSDREGNPVEQTIDAESLSALADKLNAGDEVLADVDHGSAKVGAEKDTQAAGWFSRFVVDPIKGLFGMLRLTKSGKELVENREYRYISPAFQLDENGKPVDMLAASLTNMPAFKGAIEPIINTQPEEMENFMEKMTKDDLVALIKETVIALNTCAEEKKEVENACSEAKTEVENSEAETAAEEKAEEVAEAKEDAEEAKTEIKEEKTEVENTEVVEVKEKPEEEKEEVVKLEALNSMPTVKPVGGVPEWQNLHGEAFFNWLKNHKS